MRILLLSFGSRGDVQPYVALGRALKARGHEVTLSTGRGFESLIESHGVTAAPLSVDVRALINRPDIQEALHSLRGKVRAWRATREMSRRLLNEMWDIARQEKPDVIVYHIKAYAALDIAEALGCLAVPSFQIPAFVPTRAFANPLLPFRGLGGFGNRLGYRFLIRLTQMLTSGMVDDWRQSQLDLPPASSRNVFDGYHPKGRAVPRLHGFSRFVIPKPEDWDQRDVITGYWFLDQASGWQAPETLVRFLAEGPPPVYVGFGSMPGDGEKITRIVIEALAATGQRGVLASGWGGLASIEVSDRIYQLDSAPHDWLFPRCAAVVHHGGAGTTHEGLRWGRPSIVCPVFGDQPFWGRRVRDLGAGPAPLPLKKLSSDALAAALGATGNAGMIDRAGEIATEMAQERGVGEAVAVIETLAVD